MERRGFKTAAALTLLLASPAMAQDSLTWSGRVGYAREEFRSSTPGWTPWETWDASVVRRGDRGSLALGAVHTRRFDLAEVGVMADAYHRLWRGAYGNLRAQTGDRITASLDVGAEIFQAFAEGFEGSLAARQMRFSNATVRMASVSLGRYAGPWFGRLRVGAAFQGRSNDANPSVSVIVRRQLDERQGFLEASVGVGTEAVVSSRVQTNGIVSVRNTGFVAAGAQKYFTPRFGAHVGASTVTFDGIPRRIGGSVALLTRW